MSSPLPRLRSTEGKLRLRGTKGPATLLLPGHKPASAFQELPPVPSLTGQAARPGHSQAPDQARPLPAAFCFSFLVCFFSKEVKLQRLLAAKAAWTGAAASRPWGEGAAGQGRAREARPSLPTPHSPLETLGRTSAPGRPGAQLGGRLRAHTGPLLLGGEHGGLVLDLIGSVP